MVKKHQPRHWLLYPRNMSLNIGFITWIIKKGDFRKFHNSKVGEFMVSEEVQTQDMRWYCKCYPNGSKHKYEGWVGLSLALKRSTIPSHLSNIIVRYYLYESQSSAISRGIARFNNMAPPSTPSIIPNTNSVLSNSTITSNGSNNGSNLLSSSFRSLSSLSLSLSGPSPKTKSNGTNYAKSNGTNYLVQLDVLKRFDIVILKCEFEIVRMYQRNKELCYGAPLRLHKVVQFEWNIGDRHLLRLRNTENPYTRFYSQEFSVWNLVLVPCATTIGSKDNLSLRLRLYELPPAVASISVIVRLSSAQFGVSWTTVCELSYDSPWVSWPPSTLKKQVVDEHIDNNGTSGSSKELTFECRIEILSLTLSNTNNIHRLKVNDYDSKYKSVWNRYVIDHHNVFMKGHDTRYSTAKGDGALNGINGVTGGAGGDQKENEYDVTEYDLSGEDENDEQRKEEKVRMELLKSLDLTDSAQQQYLMQTIYAMKENERILRGENDQNLKMMKQLQSMMHSMQKSMNSMKSELDILQKKKSQKEDDAQFLKKMKREKAKRDKMRDDDSSKKRKTKKRKKSKSSIDSTTKSDIAQNPQNPNKSENVEFEQNAEMKGDGVQSEEKTEEILDSNQLNESEPMERVTVSLSMDKMDGNDGVDGVDANESSKRRVHSAKQQLFKTWLEMVVHLPQYFELFVDAGYEDLSYLENMKLTEHDLTQIGIEKPGHRQKILLEIQNMKQSATNMAVGGGITGMGQDDEFGVSNGDLGGDGQMMADEFYLDVEAPENGDDAIGW